MSRRSSSLNRIDSGVSRHLGNQYAEVLKVANNIDAVVKAASVDLEALALALEEATDFEGISVVSGSTAGWDPVTKVITVPTIKGDTGEDLSLISIEDNGNGVFTWNFSDGTVFQTPSLTGPRGLQGIQGPQGEKGDFVALVNVTHQGNGIFKWTFDDGSSYTTPSLTGPRGLKGDKGDKGDKGEDLTIEQIVSNPDGTFIWQFSDGTTYTTPNLKGPQGPKGEQGNKGDQGVSVHHLRATSTTDPEGDYGTFGELDTYTFYGDAHETNVLGWFSVRNGVSANELEPLGIMRTTTYDTNFNGVVDNSEKLEGASLADVQSFVTDRTGDTSLLNTAAKDLTGAVNEVRSTLNNLDDHVAVEVTRLDQRVDTEQSEREQNVLTLNTRIDTEVSDINSDLLTLTTDKYDKTGGHISGDVSISGKLTVQGGMAEVEAEHVSTSDTIVRLNDGEVGAGVTNGFAGIEIDRGTETDYEFGFNETTGLFEIGKVGDRQPLLTRMLSPVANKFFRWNDATKQAETADVSWGDVTDKLSDISKTEAETGTATTSRFWSSLRVREAILGWWNSSASKTKLDGIETGAQVNSVTSVSGKTGAVTLEKGDVGLSNVDNVQQAPITRTISAGTGLSGGGDLTVDRTVSLGTPGTLSGDTANAVTGESHTHEISDATETVAGVVELATNAEVQAGTDTSRAVTPAGLASRTATETRTGLVEKATNAEALAGTVDKFPDAAGVRAVIAQDAPTKTGTGASGTWGISITGNAATATKLATARTINGAWFDGTANIETTEWVHSDRDFVNGTLISTSIDYSGWYGDPWVLEIRGNSYWAGVPFDIQYQGYIYSGTIISHGGYSNGTNISDMVALNVGGQLCFWFPRQDYWQGFNVRVYSAWAGRATNRVLSITDAAKPAGTREVALSVNIRQSLNSGDFKGANQSLTSNGYQKLPGGLIIQWGFVNCPANYVANTRFAFNFPIAFPSSVLHIILSNVGVNNETPGTQVNFISRSMAEVVWGQSSEAANGLSATYIVFGF